VSDPAPLDPSNPLGSRPAVSWSQGEAVPTFCERCGAPGATEISYLRDGEGHTELLCEPCKDRYLQRVRADDEERDRDAGRPRISMAAIGWILVVFGGAVLALTVYGYATR
jgi:hypothetical protein